jgi:hypothetical protein
MNKWILLFPIACACSSSDATRLDTHPPSSNSIGTSSLALYEDDESNCGAEGYACVGGRECVESVCSPAWIEMEDDGAPAGRAKAGAAFLDGKYVLLGGCSTVSTQNAALTSSVSYDLSNDTWGSAPSLATGRAQFATQSTKSGVFIFGGIGTCYNGTASGPQLDVLHSLGGSWSGVISPDVPSARYNPSLALTDSVLSVFGGSDSVNATLGTGSTLSIGGSWQDIECDLSGCSRGASFFSFVDDNVLHVFSDSGGLLHDFENHQWYNWVLPSGTPTVASITDGDPPRFGDDGHRLYVLANDDTVRIFDRSTQAWVTDDATPPSGFCSEAASVWTGSELVAWGGKCDSALSTVGGRYQPPAPGL